MSLISLKRLLGLIFVSLLLNSTTLAADGKSIFKAKCAVCHSLGDNRGTGPGLKGVSGRIKDKNIAYQWVQNVDTHKGDAYFANLIKDYGQLMSNFQSELNADEVKAVVDYIYSEPGDGKDKGPKVASTTGDVQVENANAGFDPLYLILGAIAILAILIGIFRSIRAAMHNQALRAAGKPIVDEDTTFWDEAKQWMRGHRKLMGVFVILLVLIGMRGCWNGLFDLGVYANPETGEYYSPEQPIKFSHKIHAGDNAIACQYCHNTVEKSKHAGIPTVNVCMKCHKGIQEGPITGKPEIAKIHEAAGFDPVT